MAKTYEAYKDSGIAWIGKIPSHWEVVPLKRIGNFDNGLTYSPNDVCETGILVLRSSNIQNSKISLDDNVFVGNVPSRLMVSNGDIIICSRNGSADLVGKCAIFEENLPASFGAFMMRFRTTNSNRFYFYVLNIAFNMYKALFPTSTINQLTKGVLDEIKVAFTCISEQQAIASFLDKKCGEIDSLIALQEEMIRELQAYKQSVITEAVTRGLDHNVKMKDSGVEWIGEIPATWEIKPLKSLYYTEKGLNITKENLVDCGIPVLNYGQIHSKENPGTKINDDLFKYVPESYLQSDSKCLVKKGCFLFADTSEDYEGCGNAIYVDKDLTLFAGYHTIVARPITDGDYKYFAYLFLTDIWRQQIRSRVSGIKVFSVNQKQLRTTSVILPVKAEQQTIATYLDTKTSQIDSLISIKQEKIAELKDYKKSIIYEYVTGKKKV